jgi:hypothetical protein
LLDLNIIGRLSFSGSHHASIRVNEISEDIAVCEPRAHDVGEIQLDALSVGPSVDGGRKGLSGGVGGVVGGVGGVGGVGSGDGGSGGGGGGSGGGGSGGVGVGVGGSGVGVGVVGISRCASCARTISASA